MASFSGNAFDVNAFDVDAFDVVVTSGPTLTTPTSGTNGTNIQSTGTSLDTITTSKLRTTVGGHEIALTITAQTATTINEDFESGVNDCTSGVPAAGVPMTPTITAAGITAYQLEHEVSE